MANRNGEAPEIWWAGLACATASVALGLAYLAAAGAPIRMIGMNIAAYVIGFAAYLTVSVPRWRIGRLGGWLLPVLASLLLATALASVPVDGAARWVAFGPIVLQVSLLLLPVMTVLFARAPETSGAAALAVAALALALQPDRAMAGALALGVTVLAAPRRDRWASIALVAALAGFAATLAQPDRLPAVPFVDGIFYSAFDVHPLAGASLLLGAALLIVPALLGLSDPAQRVPAAAFGAVWLAIIAAAALGNYPTPVVGYGGSAIVGYMFSLAVLRLARGRAGASRSPAGSMDPSADERSMRVGLVGMGRAAAIADRSATAPRESRAARHYRMLRRHR